MKPSHVILLFLLAIALGFALESMFFFFLLSR